MCHHQAPPHDFIQMPVQYVLMGYLQMFKVKEYAQMISFVMLLEEMRFVLDCQWTIIGNWVRTKMWSANFSLEGSRLSDIDAGLANL